MQPWRRKVAIFLILTFSLTSSMSLEACTSMNINYKKAHWSARNFDWMDPRADLVITPHGFLQHAVNLPAQQHPISWRSRYNSVNITMVKGSKPNLGAVVDAINDQGLSAAVLELDKTQYPTIGLQTPAIGSSQLIQYIVDQCATVTCSLALIKKSHVVASVYNNKKVPLHYILNDASGHAAVVEYLNGVETVFSAQQFKTPVLTNTIYSKALSALAGYDYFGGKAPLPGGIHSLARFVRAAAYLKQLQQPQTRWQVISYLLLGLDQAAQPLGTETPTQWTLVRDNSRPELYWRTSRDQRIRWLSLTAIPWQRLHRRRYLSLSIAQSGSVAAVIAPKHAFRKIKSA